MLPYLELILFTVAQVAYTYTSIVVYTGGQHCIYQLWQRVKVVPQTIVVPLPSLTKKVDKQVKPQAKSNTQSEILQCPFKLVLFCVTKMSYYSSFQNSSARTMRYLYYHYLCNYVLQSLPFLDRIFYYIGTVFVAIREKTD